MMIELTSEYLSAQGLSSNFPERFWAKVRKTDSCWIWTAATDHNGYGAILSVAKRPGNCMIGAHRGSWLIHYGPIPLGKGVLHKCDCSLCVRPDHLFLGDQLTNVRDMIGKNRMPRGKDRAFAKLTDEQVQEIRNLYASGNHFQRELAKQFGIAYQTVGNIVRGETWQHLIQTTESPPEYNLSQ